MFFEKEDRRTPLERGSVISIPGGSKYIIDQHLGSGGFSLTYLAHMEGEAGFVVLKELFPRMTENGATGRAADGKITVRPPSAGEESSDTEWEELRKQFRREAEITRLASTMYGSDGKKVLQNNPDVLRISGPWEDEIGNCYMAVDTAQGETLRSVIQRGFIWDDGGRVVSNGALEDILSILKDVALLLSHLHGDAGFWHLDLSPNNIYVTRTAGGTRLTPFLIDYGSAYMIQDPEEPQRHRYTCNPFSPPEIMSLAEFDSQESGYSPSASADTYAVVSILFYALTGEVYSAGCGFGQKLRERLMSEYGLEDADQKHGMSFGESLLNVLEKGLCASPAARYITADELFRALSRLQWLYRGTGRLLPLVPTDELMSYLLLEKYPLYAYQSSDDRLEVLCLGDNSFVRRMILSMLSCGQMLGRNLVIHVVSRKAGEDLREALLSRAPELKNYSNLKEEAAEARKYVEFSFEERFDLRQPGCCDALVKAYGDCRYMIISLGSNSENTDLARLYGKSLTAGGHVSDSNALICYDLTEDAASNRRAHVDECGISQNVTLVPFGSDLSSFHASLRSLAHRTVRLNYLYDKLDNPRISLAESAQLFSGRDKAYEQRSSCAAALHLKYKLASVGINPTPGVNHRAIIPAYLKALSGPTRNALLELEHRRWMMYMISDGYRFPDMKQIDSYAYRRMDGVFHKGFKDKVNRWHHCLVPCSDRGICLDRRQEAWDQYQTYEEIDASSYDELDKMSLKVHLLAAERINDPRTRKKLLDDFENGVGSVLEQWFAARSKAALEAEPEEKKASEGVSRLYRAIREAYDDLYNAFSGASPQFFPRQTDKLKVLEYKFRNAGIHASDGFQRVQEDLEVFREFSSYRDYKAPDITTIDYLPWLMFADEKMTLLKLRSTSLLSNVMGPLILEPKRLIYVGMKQDERISNFLYAHGNRCSVQFVPAERMEMDAICRMLAQIKGRISGRCVIDISGADEMMIAAAVRLSQTESNVALLRCNTSTGRIENISGFYLAGAYRMSTSLSAREIYGLFGASETGKPREYMLRLGQAAEKLWQFYLEYQDDWEKVSAFFANRGSGTPELKFVFQRKDVPTWIWGNYSRILLVSVWESLHLKECFTAMERCGFLRKLQTSAVGPQGLLVEFQYPTNFSDDPKNDVALKAFNSFFTYKVLTALAPFSFKEELTDKGTWISLQSGSNVEIRDRTAADFADKRDANRDREKRIPYQAVFKALRRLEEFGLLYNLSLPEKPEQLPVSIYFSYPDLAVKECLMTAGNILELFAWYSAYQAGEFDDCIANFAFQWKEGVSNELDLILTRGFRVLVVSCKTAKFNKEHLYEIKYLTDHFSLNSTPVIVYTSKMAVEDGKLTSNTRMVKERAKAMGVYLIDLNEVDPKDLGRVFVSIADGNYPL